MGRGVILDFNREFVAECDSLDTAIDAVVIVNGTTPDDVRRGIQTQAEYLRAVRTARVRRSRSS